MFSTCVCSFTVDAEDSHSAMKKRQIKMRPAQADTRLDLDRFLWAFNADSFRERREARESVHAHARHTYCVGCGEEPSRPA